MTLSNYPAGVTGTELQITGPPDGRMEERECDAEAFFIPDYHVRNLLTALHIRLMLNRERVLSAEELRLAVGRDLEQFKTDAEPTQRAMQCLFKGEVEVALLGKHGPEQWTCPQCGTEHENEI